MRESRRAIIGWVNIDHHRARRMNIGAWGIGVVIVMWVLYPQMHL
jgi:hypothetical protein